MKAGDVVTVDHDDLVVYLLLRSPVETAVGQRLVAIVAGRHGLDGVMREERDVLVLVASRCRVVLEADARTSERFEKSWKKQPQSVRDAVRDEVARQVRISEVKP